MWCLCPVQGTAYPSPGKALESDHWCTAWHCCGRCAFRSARHRRWQEICVSVNGLFYEVGMRLCPLCPMPRHPHACEPCMMGSSQSLACLASYIVIWGRTLNQSYSTSCVWSPGSTNPTQPHSIPRATARRNVWTGPCYRCLKRLPMTIRQRGHSVYLLYYCHGGVPHDSLQDDWFDAEHGHVGTRSNASRRVDSLALWGATPHYCAFHSRPQGCVARCPSARAKCY